MGNIFQEDFSDFLISLDKNNVEYIIVGGYAVILRGYSRTTGDLDIWVNKTQDNYRKLTSAFYEFGLALFDMTEHNFLYVPDYNVFSFGRSPVSIDIMTEVKGLKFEECFPKSSLLNVDNLSVRVLDYRDLIKAKKASNRPKDLDDLENLPKH